MNGLYAKAPFDLLEEVATTLERTDSDAGHEWLNCVLYIRKLKYNLVKFRAVG